MPDRPASHRPRRRKRVVAAAASLLVSCAVAELAVRRSFGAPQAERLPLSRIQANAFRGWQMVPGEDHYTYDYLVHVNALGLRGAEVPEQKAADEVRVLALGDSTIYGQGVPDEETVPAYVEGTLHDAAGARWRVVNGGHRAYGTNQELGLLRELGARVAPDVVVLFWYDNDVEEYDIARNCAHLEASGPRYFDLDANGDGLALWAWHAKQLLRRSALVMQVNDLVGTGVERTVTRAMEDEGLTRLDAQLHDFQAACDELGALPVFAVVPHPRSLGAHGADTPQARRADAALRTAEEHGIAVIELVDDLRELAATERRRLTIPYDGHYLGVANERMGRRVAAALLALRLETVTEAR